MLSGCLNEALYSPLVKGLLMRETSERKETLGDGSGAREGWLCGRGRDDGGKSQRLYQVSMGTVLDLECNLSKGFFFANCLSCWVCVAETLGPLKSILPTSSLRIDCLCCGNLKLICT